MIWNRLKNQKCPSCNGDLFETPMATYKCDDCDFTIGKTKFNDLIEKMYKTPSFKKKGDDEVEDNMSQLNNM